MKTNFTCFEAYAVFFEYFMGFTVPIKQQKKTKTKGSFPKQLSLRPGDTPGPPGKYNKICGVAVLSCPYARGTPRTPGKYNKICGVARTCP